MRIIMLGQEASKKSEVTNGIKIQVLVMIILAVTVFLPIFNLNASTTFNNQPINHLIDALVEINKPKSLKIAEELKLRRNNVGSYNLIIRRASLNSLDAKKISKAIEKIKQNNGPLLDTISMSFNKDLGDNGLDFIIKALPKSTSTIAFVDCGLTDVSGKKIIDWAYTHEDIKEIYLEGNLFSKNIINEFMKLKYDKPEISMIVEWPSEGFKKMVIQNYK